jgi:autotransporter-associated beta strand protein
MNPEDLTTHALGEPLPLATQAALEQALQSDAQTRADFEATQAFTQFLHQNLATDHPEATLTEDQKQNLTALAQDRGASRWLARNPGDQARRPTTLRWLTRTLLPLSAAALLVLGFQQWQEEAQPPFITQTELKDIAGREIKPVAASTSSPAPEESATSPAKSAPTFKQDAVAATPQDLPRSRMLNEVGKAWESTPAAAPKPTETTTPANSGAFKAQIQPGAKKELFSSSIAPDLSKSGAGSIQLSESSTYTGSTTVSAGALQMDSASAPAARASATRDSIDLQLSYSNAPASPSSPPTSTPPATADSFVGDVVINGHLFQTTDGSHRRQNTPTSESYTPIQENPLTPVLREPLSTFSIDVDTASYANTRRFLNRSSLPPRDAVRIEELVNYFPYNLEAPAPDSPHPFAVHVEVADCPWQPRHRLARIGIQGKKVGLEQRNSNFVFLIDVSGSMDQPDKLPLVKESLRLLVEQLDEKDRVSIVTYAGSSGLVLPPTPGDQKDRLLAAITNMSPGGSTHGSAGIQLAYEQAIAAFIPDGVNRVILCSDGDFNVGISSPSDLEKLITEKARSGVFLSVLGYGTGNLKDRTMETLADKGNGNYGYIDSLSEARKLLVEQMTGTLITIAKDVKIQVEFNPAQVASYRLIGYENRLLAKEDFNDDTKDAGEIGAGHSVTALYEIVPVGLTPPTTPVDPLKYQTLPVAGGIDPGPPVAGGIDPGSPAAPAAASPELLTVKLRYKAPDAATSQLIEVPVTDQKTTLAAATPEFKFTTAVAAYGLMLRQSSYRGPLTWDQIRNLALEGKTPDPHGYRTEFLQLLDKARGLLPSNQ